MQLTSFSGPSAGNPRWSPDGRRLGFIVHANGSAQIYAIDAGGGVPMLIQTDSSAEAPLNWSRDGNWIYFVSRRSGQAQVWKASTGDGAAVQVTKNGGFQARESPDGKFVYYTKAPRQGLWQVPVGGGEEHRMMDGFQGTGELVDGGLYFITRTAPPARPTLQFFSFATAAVKIIAEIDTRAVGAFAVSPDQKTLVYEQTETRGTDLMLVDNFR